MLLLLFGITILIISSYTKKARKLGLNEMKWSALGLITSIILFALSYFISFFIIVFFEIGLTQVAFDGICLFSGGIGLFLIRKINFNIMEKEALKLENNENILDDINF